MDRIADPIVEAYATVLRMRRREAGLSQEQLAHRAGLSMRFISLLEGSRHRPTLVTMHKIAEALDLPLSEICLLYTSPSPRDRQKSRMPSSA